MKQLLGQSPSGLFATQTLTGHVIRGAVALPCSTLLSVSSIFTLSPRWRRGILALVVRGFPLFG